MSTRFHKILVPVDFVDHNQSALDVALEFGANAGADVTLLHVIEAIDEGDLDEDPEVREFYQRMENRAVGELATMRQKFEDAGIEVTSEIRFGKRAPEIVNFSESHATDLIVMRSHVLQDRKSAANLLTLSYQVSLICACPVLLVK